jgi:hypothetical protein
MFAIPSFFGFQRAGFGPNVDPDAQAFFDRVTAAGGTLSVTEQTATNQLVLDMKAAGIWTAMRAVYPMVGASAAACSRNLKADEFNGSFSTGWTFASTGVTPNGTSAFMNTNFNPFTQLAVTSAHASFYLRTPLNIGAIGYGVVKNDYSERMDIINFGGTLYSAMGSQGQNATTTTPYQSLILGSRTSSTSNKLYTIGVLRDTKTALNTANLPSNNYWLGAVNQAGGFFTSQQCAFASLGDGLTDTQASDFYTAVQAFQTTLSRNV